MGITDLATTIVVCKRLFKGRVVFLCLTPRAKDSQNREADNKNQHKTGKESPKCTVKKFEHIHKYNKNRSLLSTQNKTPPCGGVLEAYRLLCCFHLVLKDFDLLHRVFNLLVRIAGF